MKAESLARRIALAGFALVLACGCATHDRSVTAPKISKLRTAHELRVMTFNLRVRTILDGHEYLGQATRPCRGARPRL